jgi:hypothetical protein
MNGHLLTWGIVALFVLVMLAGVAMFARRRHASRGLDREERLRLAKRAARQAARESRRATRGSLRGKGGGGDEALSQSAGVTSESGGIP